MAFKVLTASEISQIIQEHRRWFISSERKPTDLKLTDPSGHNFTVSSREGKLADFSLTDLSGYNFTGFNLQKAKMVGCKMCNCLLIGTDLRKADLYCVDFCDANLSKANLSGCDLRGTYLRGAILDHAILAFFPRGLFFFGINEGRTETVIYRYPPAALLKQLNDRFGSEEDVCRSCHLGPPLATSGHWSHTELSSFPDRRSMATISDL